MNKRINEFDRMVSGKLYNADHEDIREIHERGMSRCEKFNNIPMRRKNAKKHALEKLIPSARGKDFGIFTPFYCEYGVNIHVGKGCFCNYNCIFLDISPITLGDNVWIGANVTLATPNHPFIAEERIVREYPDGVHDLEYSAPITIKDNTWICSGVTVCGGVTIGKNCVIAAGAVVTRDIPDNYIAAGIPARVVRKIDESDRIGVWDTYVKNEKPVSKRKREIDK